MRRMMHARSRRSGASASYRARYVRLFEAQRLYGIEARGEVGRDQRGERTDDERNDADLRDVARDDFCGDLRELVDLPREHLDAECVCEPLAEFIAVANQRHAKA